MTNDDEESVGLRVSRSAILGNALHHKVVLSN